MGVYAYLLTLLSPEISGYLYGAVALNILVVFVLCRNLVGCLPCRQAD